MFKRHATFTRLRQRANQRPAAQPVRCNHADNYYGDRVCTNAPKA